MMVLIFTSEFVLPWSLSSGQIGVTGNGKSFCLRAGHLLAIAVLWIVGSLPCEAQDGPGAAPIERERPGGPSRPDVLRWHLGVHGSGGAHTRNSAWTYGELTKPTYEQERSWGGELLYRWTPRWWSGMAVQHTWTWWDAMHARDFVEGYWYGEQVGMDQRYGMVAACSAYDLWSARRKKIGITLQAGASIGAIMFHEKRYVSLSGRMDPNMVPFLYDGPDEFQGHDDLQVLDEERQMTVGGQVWVRHECHFWRHFSAVLDLGTMVVPRIAAGGSVHVTPEDRTIGIEPHRVRFAGAFFRFGFVGHF